MLVYKLMKILTTLGTAGWNMMMLTLGTTSSSSSMSKDEQKLLNILSISLSAIVWQFKAITRREIDLIEWPCMHAHSLTPTSITLASKTLISLPSTLTQLTAALSTMPSLL
jgi:hypothetical protein